MTSSFQLSTYCTIRRNFFIYRSMWRNVFRGVSNVYFRMCTVRAAVHSTAMEKVHMRLVDGEEHFDLWLKYKFQESQKECEFNFTRLQNETLSRTLERMQASLAKKASKRQKKKSKKNPEEGNVQAEIALDLFKGDEPWDNSVIAKLAWTSPDSSLMIEGKRFGIFRNPPKVKTLKLPTCLMAGFPIVPIFDVEFADINNSAFHWYKEVLENEQPVEANGSKKRRRSNSNGEMKFELVHTGVIFTPSENDVGRKLKLVCTPSDGNNIGLEVEGLSKVCVTQGPLNCPFQHRHNLTRTPCEDNSFRIVSYNLLANVYADSEYSRNFLFPHCPRDKLDMSYRKYLLIKELQGYNADIICLQEVDGKLFTGDLVPVFNDGGYDGFLCLKRRQVDTTKNGCGSETNHIEPSDEDKCTGAVEEFNTEEEGNAQKSVTVSEGVATFFRKNKFKLLQQIDTNVTDALKQDEALWEKICTNESLKTSLERRPSVVQTTLLENLDNGRKVLVATTHLFFHPRANNIRLLQTFGTVKHIQSLLDTYKDQSISVIFCGDFNANPMSAVHSLMTKGTVKSNHADWYSEGKARYIPDMEVKTDLTFTSACGYPQYTNYVPSFSGCLDYIYIDSNLTTERVIPLPSHEEVTEFTALPNEVFPSDHLALVCDLTWTEEK